jgi:hypothetical protein
MRMRIKGSAPIVGSPRLGLHPLLRVSAHRLILAGTSVTQGNSDLLTECS